MLINNTVLNIQTQKTIRCFVTQKTAYFQRHIVMDGYEKGWKVERTQRLQLLHTSPLIENKIKT
jgi:hypothetical protein